MQIESLEYAQEELREAKSEQRRVQLNYDQEIQKLESIAPAWITANDALEALRDQTEAELEDSQAVMTQMQQVLEDEKSQAVAKDQLATRRAELEQEIERLASPRVQTILA